MEKDPKSDESPDRPPTEEPRRTSTRISCRRPNLTDVQISEQASISPSFPSVNIPCKKLAIQPAIKTAIYSVNPQSSEVSSKPSCCRSPLPTGFSLVVDDVDAGQEPDEASDAEEASGSRRDRTREATPDDKREMEARIQQFKVEAESRKNEFARLLEEHEQVVCELKLMEDETSPSHA